MKVLITGKNSYAGKEFIKRMHAKDSDLVIDAISVRDNKWMTLDFSVYDAIYHVAAIVHLKEKPSMEQEYYRVNSNLPYEIAHKAKSEGVKSFVFLSSIAVYGILGQIGKDIVISKETKESPKTFNGKSKLAAEKLLIPLQSKNFNIAILRIPLIYGYNCPGNYNSLSKLARLTPVFPNLNNKKSMIFIDHLSDIVEFIIRNKKYGTFLVNNPENFNTLYLVKEIAKNHDKKIFHSNILSVILKLFGNRFSVTQKLFGTVYYKIEDTKIEDFKFEATSFEKTIALSEGIVGGQY